MKKTYLAMMALAVLTLSCAKSEMPETPSGTTHVIKADMADTGDEPVKTTYTPAGAFSWVSGDQFKLVTYNAASSAAGSYVYRTAGTGKSANFSATTATNFTANPRAGYAVYPSSLAVGGTKDAYTVTLPAEYTVTGSDFAAVGVPLIGTPVTEDNYSFKTAVGVLKVRLYNIPASARKLVLTSAADNLSGVFALNADAASDGLLMSACTGSAGHSITVNFPFQTPGATVDVYIPVPVGTLSVGAVFEIQQSDGTAVFTSVSTKSALTVARGHLTPITAAMPNVIFFEDFDKDPTFDSYLSSGTWKNPRGAGASGTTYSSYYGRVRKPDAYGSNNHYEGASGESYARLTHYNSTFGNWTINNISTCGYKDFTLSFGAAQDKEVMSVSWSTDGSSWNVIDYSVSGPDYHGYNSWGLATGSFSIPAGTQSIYIKLTLLKEYSDSYKYGANIDDFCLVSSGIPQAEDFVPGTINRYAELPADEVNSDYFYNTLYTHTVTSNQAVRNYSFCYDTRRHNPIWVAFPMHAIYAEGSGRSTDGNGKDPWMQYPDLPVSQQSIIWDIAGDGYMYWSRTTLADGSWTKGHLCMSSSRAGAGKEINLQTFYPVNIAPQSNKYAGIFSDLWSATENLHWQHGSQICSDTLYVVAGCHYANDSNIEYDACNWNTHSVNSKACVIPTHQYKLLLRTRSGNTGKPVQNCTASELKAIGFWFDAVIPSGASSNLADYAMSVADIEAITGHTFFPGIPDSVKQQCTPSDWL